MDPKATFIAGWFAASLITLTTAIGGYIYLAGETYMPVTHQNLYLYAALPKQMGELSDQIIPSDGRSKVVESFFKQYNSTLLHYSDTFVQVADKYHLDWRLLPAIAMQESNGAKRVIKNSYNPFGFGIYGNKVIRFSSWEAGIDRVGKALREDYLDKGLVSVEQIMTKYTPPSLSSGGSWAKGVNSFMFELN